MIFLSGIWLTEDLRDFYKIPKYNSVHHVRGNRSGGGVSLVIHSDFDFKIRYDLT